jgi:hypothetical protein
MSKEKFVVFNPEGGLGKIIASTSVVRSIRAHFPDRKIIVITPWPEVYLNNPNVYRVFRAGHTPYFYKDYIKDHDTIVLKSEPYFNTGHLYNKQQLTKSWCDTHNIPYDGNNTPELYFTNAEISKIKSEIIREKPILIMQTNGGVYNNSKKYCWTRDIPHGQAQILANELSKHFSILHVSRPTCNRLINTETVNEMDKRSLMLLLTLSQKRLLIDSCLQHAAAALNLKSTVLWVATHPEVFGYDMHCNIKPSAPQIQSNTSYIDSVFFDYDFNGPEHEYPFETSDIFDLQQVFNSIVEPVINNENTNI